MQTTRRLMGWLVAAMVTAIPLHAQDDYYNQLASMETGQQWNFTPDSYYYSRVWRKILDLPGSWFDVHGWEPGLGFHDKGAWIPWSDIYIKVIFNPNALAVGHLEAVYKPTNYVNERWRVMTPLRMTTVANSILQSKNTEDEKQYWKEINLRDMMVLVDRSTLIPLVGARVVTEDERDEYSQQVLDNLHNISELGGEYDKIVEQYRMEYDVIREEISVVSDSYEDNAKRLRSLQECNKRLKVLAEETATMYSCLQAAQDPLFKKVQQNRRKRFCIIK